MGSPRRHGGHGEKTEFEFTTESQRTQRFEIGKRKEERGKRKVFFYVKI